MRIELTGYASLRADITIVDELRALVAFLDSNKVRGDADVEFDRHYVWIAVTNDFAAADFIECADHKLGDERFDVVINTHEHKYNGPDNYEEALEMAEPRPYKTETLSMYEKRTKGA